VKPKVLLIGLSTGGPSHIQYFLSKIKKLNAIVIIAQHMKCDVIDFFIHDLQSNFHYCIKSTPVSLRVDDPCVVVCKESAVVDNVNKDGFEIVNSTLCDSRFTPDINKLFHSASQLCSLYDLYAVVMTGIGDDGAEGLLHLKKEGAMTIAESQESSAIFGMPRRAIEIGAAKEVLSLNELIEFCQKEGILDV